MCSKFLTLAEQNILEESPQKEEEGGQVTAAEREWPTSQPTFIYFSNEAIFHLSGKAKQKNVCIWGSNNLPSTHTTKDECVLHCLLTKCMVLSLVNKQLMVPLYCLL